MDANPRKRGLRCQTIPFVDVGGLSSLGPLRYLDVRDQAAFDAAYAPGAVRVPLDEWDAVAKAADTGFAKRAYWDRALSALGLDPRVTVVAYDSGGVTNPARVWFILQYYGLNAVILNGGWPALASATGLPPAAAPSAVGFRAVPGSGSVGLIDRKTLRDQLDGRAQVLIRGRAPSSPAKMRAIVLAAAICRGRATCRMWT